MSNLIKQISVLTAITVAIVVCGVFLPRVFIRGRIDKTAQMQESVLENEVSPYGEAVVDIENKINEASRYIDFVNDSNTIREYDATLANDPTIDDRLIFTEALIETINDEYGINIQPVRYRRLLTADNVETHMAELYDGSLASSYRFLMEDDTGVVVYAVVECDSYNHPRLDRVDNIVSLYSERIGVNFTETDSDELYFAENVYMEPDRGVFYTVQKSIDGNLELTVLAAWTYCGDNVYSYTITVFLRSTSIESETNNSIAWYIYSNS